MDSKPKGKDSHKGNSEDVESNISTKKEDVGETVELVPPDGGWGWAVMFGTALSNIIMYPVVQTFALLYKDKFANIGMSATDSSIIINVNSAFGMGLDACQPPATLRDAYMPSASLRNVCLLPASLRDACLPPATLRDACLPPASLRNVCLPPASLRDDCLPPDTLRDACLPPASLRDACLPPATLLDACLPPATLRDACLPPASLRDACLPPATLLDACLPPATLLDACLPPDTLRDACLPPASLRDACLPPATLLDACLPPATLLDACLPPDTLRDACLPPASLRDAFMPSASLRNVCLPPAPLRDACLPPATLRDDCLPPPLFEMLVCPCHSSRCVIATPLHHSTPDNPLRSPCLVQGAILNRYGYRRVAIAGSILTFMGVVLTSFGNSFIHFLITYGFLTSLGVCLLYPAFSLGLNSYFRKKRGKAMGYAMTLTGIGPIIMPLLISKMMSVYGVQGTGLILGALSLHSLVGAFLLQPIKWHMKRKEEDPVEDEDEDQEDKDGDHFKENAMRNGLRRLSVSSQNQRVSHFEVETPTPESSINWWSAQSMNTINLGSSVKIFDEAGYTSLRQTGDNSENAQNKRNTKTRRKGVFRRFLGRVAKVLDLSLLKDPYYINLMVGMSIAMSAELNFSLLTPFILGDMGFSNDQTASVMSAIGIADIIFRFISPFFADYMEYSARTMYLISMAMLIASRTSHSEHMLGRKVSATLSSIKSLVISRQLRIGTENVNSFPLQHHSWRPTLLSVQDAAIIFFNTFKSLLVVAVAIGVAKGVRTVYTSLVIPSYVPIERLASASGLQMVGNGIVLMVFGPLIGKLIVVFF
uniref:Uncharacterized protein n=1 Tax=Timema poppense TaxID=170557 RepID=A0A7R9GXJ5_TIMPO|nr:unnamed protein product [Timema poppensis]